ncbi:MAG: RnfH family protein [Burkholderiales bacterium]|nr:RnfH family protein [Burkholderiales bacterium]
MIQVEVAFSPAPRQVELVALIVPVGTSLQQALLTSGLFDRVAGLSVGAIRSGDLAVGVWGRRSTLGHILHEGDRVEVYRALKVDPKEARRLRYRAHGEKLPKGIRRSKVRPGPA